MHSPSSDLNRLAYSDKTSFQCCFSNKQYELTFPFQMASPSPMTLCISKHEWAFIHHNSLLPWARGPGFLWGDQSQFSVVKPWQVCKAGLSRGVRTSSPEGGWWSRSVRAMERLQWPWSVRESVTSVSAFLDGIPGQFWPVLVWIPAQGTQQQRGWFGSQPFLSLILAQSNVYLWLCSPVPLEQAAASWKHKEKL